jgi:hypothetical protein
MHGKNSLHERVGSTKISFLVSFCVLIVHGIFIVGQSSDLWSLQIVTVTEDASLKGTLIDILPINITIPDQDNIFSVQNYSYVSTLTKLWKFGKKGVYPWYDFSAHSWQSHVTVILITLFSGVWPHVKLIAMHCLWYFTSNPKNRSSSLFWLEFFGKWSALDVFLVCYLVVVMHIEFGLTTESLVNNLCTNLPSFMSELNATALVNGLCDLLVDNVDKLKECNLLGNFFIADPDIFDAILDDFMNNVNSTGTVSINIRAVSLDGLYSFSSAVWLSLLLSCAFMQLDEHYGSEENHSESPSPFLHGEGVDVRTVMIWHKARQTEHDLARNSLLGSHDPTVDPAFRMPNFASDSRDSQKDSIVNAGFAGSTKSSWGFYLPRVLTAVLVIGSFPLLYFATTLPTIHQGAPSEVDMLFRLLTNDSSFLETDWSTEALIAVVNSGAGSGPFLSKDLIIFAMAGPAFFLLSAFVLCFLPLKASERWWVMEGVKLGASFSCHEVLIFTQIMLQVELPSLTNGVMTLLPNDIGINACNILNSAFAPAFHPCFEITTSDIWPNYALLPVTAVTFWATRYLISNLIASVSIPQPKIPLAIAYS